MAEKQKLTKEGYKQFEAEYRNLIDVEREKVKTELAEARAQGDLSENADYDAARGRQAEVEARIKELEYILANSEVIAENKSSKKVALGSTVSLKFVETGKEATYKIVGSVEASPFEGKISNACPLGLAIVGKSVGDVIEVKTVKSYKVEIIKIEG